MVWKIRTGTGTNTVWIFVLIVFSTLLMDHSFLIDLQGHQRRCKTRVLAALSPRRRRGRSNSCRSSCRSSSSSCRSSSSSCRSRSSSCRSSSSSCRSSSSSCRSYISGNRNSGSFSRSCPCNSCRNAAVLLLLSCSNFFPNCYLVIFLKILYNFS